MGKLIASIDLGTSSAKVMCIYQNGEAFRQVNRYNVDSADLSAQNAISWWKAVKEAFIALGQKVNLEEVSGVSLAAQTGTYLLYNSFNRESDIKVISWKSGSGKEQLQTLKKRFGKEYFKKHISMPHPDLISYPAPKILWLREAPGEEWKKCEKFVQPKDYMYYKLTGIFASDIYTWRGLANLIDGSFHDELLDEIGTTKEQLPVLRKPWEAPGRLQAGIAAELGLKAGIPVFVGCNDFFASLLGMGIYQREQCFDMTGTSEHIGDITLYMEDNTGLVCSPYFNDYIHYGVTANSGSSMDWAFKTFNRDLSLTDAIDNIFTRRPEVFPPVFLPYMQGERAPIWDTKSRGVFFGLECSQKPGDLFYSVMEGVVFSLYHIWTYMPSHQKSEIRVAGGAAFDDGLNRMKASLFGIPFAVMRERDSAALGAAVFAGFGMGWFTTLKDAINCWVSVERVIEPEDKLGKFLRSRFDVYKGLYPALKESFQLWEKCQGGILR